MTAELDLIREAAATMRARAWRCQAIFGGEFRIEPGGGQGDWPRSLYNGRQLLATKLDRADAEHIAGMHPAVALAVADLLEAVADRWTHFPDRRWDAAVTAARTFLGRPQ